MLRWDYRGVVLDNILLTITSTEEKNEEEEGKMSFLLLVEQAISFTSPSDGGGLK